MAIQGFQYKYLCIVILAGAVITGLLLVGSHVAVNPIAEFHVRSMSLFTLVSIGLWLGLRGRPRWFIPIAWCYECICVLEYISALYFVSEDEFRVVWFLTNIPGVYLLLGQRAGLVITVFTIIGLIVGNSYLPSPYSSNALATLVTSILFLGIVFHIYAGRSLSYFTRMRDSNQKLFELSTRDPLTGILNSHAYYDFCEQLIARSKRAGSGYCILFIDLDHFKMINDTYGHGVGDVVLKTTVACIHQTIRASDLLGRVGGEEFSVLLPDTYVQSAHQITEKIRQAVADLVIPLPDQQSIHITASIGVACDMHCHHALEEIQQQADLAMYQAKKQGRNRVSCLHVMAEGNLQEGR